MSVSGHDLATSYDCKVPGCTNEARSARGQLAYLCDKHADEKRRYQNQQATKPRQQPPADGLEAAVRELGQLGKQVDKAKARATKATERALVAKRELEELEQRFQARARELMGEAA